MLAWFCWCFCPSAKKKKKKNLLWNLWKGEVSVWHSYNQSLFCFMILDWKSCQEMEGSKDQGFFLNLHACLSSCVCSNICAICVYFMHFKGIQAWPQQGQLALSGPICTVPFHVLECVMQRVKRSGSCTAKHAHRGTSVTSIADRTIIISYSLERCWSPSATGALHPQTHMASSLIKIRTNVKDVNRKCRRFSFRSWGSTRSIKVTSLHFRWVFHLRGNPSYRFSLALFKHKPSSPAALFCF